MLRDANNNARQSISPRIPRRWIAD